MGGNKKNHDEIKSVVVSFAARLEDFWSRFLPDRAGGWFGFSPWIRGEGWECFRGVIEWEIPGSLTASWDPFFANMIFEGRAVKPLGVFPFWWNQS